MVVLTTIPTTVGELIILFTQVLAICTFVLVCGLFILVLHARAHKTKK